MIIGLTGSQAITPEQFQQYFPEDLKLMHSWIHDEFHSHPTSREFTYVLGSAKGFDTFAYDLLMKEQNRTIIRLKPIYEYVPGIWTQIHNQGYYARDMQVVENADILFIFWNGRSPGTKMTGNAFINLLNQPGSKKLGYFFHNLKTNEIKIYPRSE